MRFSAGRNDILDALTTATRAINAKSTLPILCQVHIKANGNGVRISATDLSIAIECDVPDSVTGIEGALTLSGKTLLKIVKGLPKQNICMTGISETHEYTDSKERPCKRVDWKSTLECSGTKFTLEAISADEFPAVPRPEGDVSSFSISQRELLKLIMETKVSIGWDDPRPPIQAAHISFPEGNLQMVTTDTNRLTVSYAPLLNEPIVVDTKEDTLIPGSALSEIARMLSDKSEEPVNVIFDKQTMRFCVGNVALTTRLEHGTFPKYKHVIPHGHHWALTANRKALIDGIKRIFIVAQDGESYLALRADTNAEEADGTRSPGNLRLVTWSMNLGKAEHLMVADVTGDPVPIAVNVNYLLDALETMKGETVRLEFGAHAVSGIKALETDNPSLLHLLMPMQLTDILAARLA